jgi:alkylation response protein AidB-like acyl-CoA dehydrogenase
MGYFPKDRVEILDTWNTFGMRGTGSADVVLEDAFVPDHLTLSPAGPFEAQPAFAGPLYRLTPWLTIQGEAVGSLAIASAAVDLLPSIAEAKSSGATSTLLRDREYVQMNIGRARALVDGARAYLYSTIDEAYALALKGQSPPTEVRVALQLAACNAAEACAKAVDLVYEAAGSASIRTEGRMQRHFRDIHVLTQHATKSAPRYISAGRVLLGLASDTPLLGGRPSRTK